MSDCRVRSVFWARGCAPLRRGCTACGGHAPESEIPRPGPTSGGS
jgi:hypothetical protein